MGFVEIPSNTVPTVGSDSPSVMEGMTLGLEEGVSEEQLRATNPLVDYIREKFTLAKTKRQTDESRWLDCFRNYRGIYSSSTQFTSSEKSQAFIKITKTKVQAAVAQISDVLFSGNKFPIGIEPPQIPLDSEDTVSFDPSGQGNQSLRSDPTMAPHVLKIFGPKKKLMEKVQDSLQPGVGEVPGAMFFEPAREAARKMEKKIHDQLNEANAPKSLRSLVVELCMLGTGVFKGPFQIEKEYPRWTDEGRYDPLKVVIPDMQHVSIWNAYPDPDASNPDDIEWFIERHKMSRTQLRGLKKRPMFRGANIDKLIKEGPNYQIEWWESSLAEDSDATTEERWEVLEFWGILDKELAEESGIKVPRKYKDYEELQVNAWISGNHVIRLVINPFKPVRIPYYIVPYEVNPYSIFGVGVAENMMDSQLLMNGFMRMAIDNAALSGNLIFEVDKDLLEPGQNLEITPGKVLYKSSAGQPGRAIESIKFDNVTNENMMMFDKARQLADESTGMPSYAHGMSGIQSTGKTAAGMSMLMGAAAQNIKDVVRNIDEYLLAPLGRDLYAFNMQFNFDKDFIGDVAVVPRGTESLMRNEIRSQKLLQLAQFAAANQAVAPMLNWDYLLRELTVSLDLDEEKLVNDSRKAAIQALEMQKLQMQMGGPQGGPSQQTQAQANGQSPGSPVPNPDDPTQTGGGVIGPGAAPEPNAEGFSGNPEQRVA